MSGCCLRLRFLVSENTVTERGWAPLLLIYVQIHPAAHYPSAPSTPKGTLLHKCGAPEVCSRSPLCCPPRKGQVHTWQRKVNIRGYFHVFYMYLKAIRKWWDTVKSCSIQNKYRGREWKPARHEQAIFMLWSANWADLESGSPRVPMFAF